MSHINIYPTNLPLYSFTPPHVSMAAFTVGSSGRFQDSETEEQTTKVAKYLLPHETIDADIMVSQNLRSINRNFPKLKEFVSRHNNIKICALQETWSAKVQYKLEGFQPLIERQRLHRRGGGVGFYLENSVKYTIVSSPFLEGSVETMCIDVKVDKRKSFRIINIYRVPEADAADLIKIIPDLPFSKTNPNIVLGDININIEDVRKHGLIELFADCGLASLIDIPTRIGTREINGKLVTTATVIDHVYTNIKLARTFVYETSISDHYTVALTLNDKRSKLKLPPPEFMSPLHDERSLDYLLAYLKAYRKSTNWEEVLECKGVEAFKIFEEIMNDAILVCCPTVKKNRRKIPQNPWMTKELLKQRYHKEKLHRKARKCKSEQAWLEFKTFNKTYNKMCRDAKNSYYGEKFESNRNDGRQLWKLANEVTGRPTKKGDKSTIGPIEGCATDLESATKINEFFATIATNLQSKIKKPKKTYRQYLPKLDSVSEGSFSFHSVTRGQVEEIIDNMKNKVSYGIDTMSNRMVKFVKDEISIPLTHLINISIKHSYVPQTWKTAKIAPIFKSGDPAQPTNYRPISLLPTLSKVLERVISNQVYGYFENNKLLYALQFGFRRTHSCEDLLLKIMDYITKAISNKKFVLNVYIDLKKAFDTCVWDILFKKLAHYGLDPNAIKWFQSYLSERRMYTRVGDSDSDMMDILCGVPQGSILGPLLFIIYINDLPHVTKLFTALYADDTTFANCNEDIDELFSHTNKLLAEVEDWFDANYLSLHPGKTRFMLFSSKAKSQIAKNSTHELFLQNSSITRVHDGGTESSFKLVGVHLDERLTFKHHIKHVHKKIIGVTALLSRSKHIVPSKMKKVLFHSLVQSHLQYCLPVWGGAAGTQVLKMSQKKAARAACGAKWIKHCDPCFANLQALKFNDMYKIACAKIALKSAMGTQVDGLSDCFIPTNAEVRATRSEPNYGPKTRLQSKNNLVMPSFNPEELRRLPTYMIPLIWNKQIPPNLKDFGLLTISEAFKLQTLAEYNSFKCRDKNCYSCNLYNFYTF